MAVSVYFDLSFLFVETYIFISRVQTNVSYLHVYLAHEWLAESDPVITPYEVLNRLFTAIYGIITGFFYRQVFASEV